MIGLAASGGGNSSADAVYSLLAIVTDPKKYEEKLRELDTRTAVARDAEAKASARVQEATEVHKRAAAKLDEANGREASAAKAAVDLKEREQRLEDAERAHVAALAEHERAVHKHETAVAAAKDVLEAAKGAAESAKREANALLAAAGKESDALRKAAANELAEVRRFADALNTARVELSKADSAIAQANDISRALEKRRAG